MLIFQLINTAMIQSLGEADRLSTEHTPAPKALIPVLSRVLIASYWKPHIRNTQQDSTETQTFQSEQAFWT